MAVEELDPEDCESDDTGCVAGGLFIGDAGIRFGGISAGGPGASFGRGGGPSLLLLSGRVCCWYAQGATDLPEEADLERERCGVLVLLGVAARTCTCPTG